MRLFISGPITGVEDYQAAFDRVWQALHDATGIDAFNPAWISNNISEKDAMQTCLCWIINHAEGIVTLPNWCLSKGARVEVALAHKLDLPRWQYLNGEFIPCSHDRRLV